MAVLRRCAIEKMTQVSPRKYAEFKARVVRPGADGMPGDVIAATAAMPRRARVSFSATVLDSDCMPDATLEHCAVLAPLAIEPVPIAAEFAAVARALVPSAAEFAPVATAPSP